MAHALQTHLAPPEAGANRAAPSPAEHTYNDKYVVLYDFADCEYEAALKEFTALLDDLEAAGLHTEVRAGFEKTILVFVKASEQLLGNTVYKTRHASEAGANQDEPSTDQICRVRDWLYGITQTKPQGDKDTVVRDCFEAEHLLALHFLVTWPKELGGAAVTPQVGQWTRVTGAFPLHNERVNQQFLGQISRRLLLTEQHLDQIRDLFGTKVAFYFAFIATYIKFLTFPALTGIITWLMLPQYSLAYALLTSVWCTVFLEYWKTRQLDLAMRWQVQGVGQSKVNRPEFQWERIVVEPSGRQRHHFPKRKRLARQLVQVPLILCAAVVLAMIICAVSAVEVLISEAYDGPYQSYLEYVPTVLLAAALPYVSSYFENIAARLTAWENHRTDDDYEAALTQKLFILTIITNYLPILLIAFVYVPYGDLIVPHIESLLVRLAPGLGLEQRFSANDFRPDAHRLRSEVIALTVTGQMAGFVEENILPLVKHRLRGWWRERRRPYARQAMLLSLVADEPDEVQLLDRTRNQATLPPYDVHQDVAELVLQFGYLALFSPVWPLVSLGFLINNLIELRSDFAKICVEHRRPPPLRADGIGPWVAALDVLAWLGSISTAAIVHLFSSDAAGARSSSSWLTLPVTIFISEHMLLLLRALTSWLLRSLGSEQLRKQRNERYALRLAYLEQIEANKRAGVGLTPAERERRKSVLVTGSDYTFWSRQVDEGVSAAAGIKLISLARDWEEANGLRNKKTD
ncbi:hypothetical protein CDD81_997 [Ophiocordyceps australis]|uniref:Uncharacterized protein n=1 Tax=Ophiocordyceps australis TaxID=1399860 RepID=A0A2C5Y187_9HYPO|nr:hypothetical protein CDD81_997 [Ophiocordyceps australis]